MRVGRGAGEGGGVWADSGNFVCDESKEDQTKRQKVEQTSLPVNPCVYEERVENSIRFSKKNKKKRNLWEEYRCCLLPFYLQLLCNNKYYCFFLLFRLKSFSKRHRSGVL